MQTLRRILIVFAVLLLLAAGGFMAWVSGAAQPMAEAAQALESDGQVQVSQERWLVFRPVGETAETGLVFYPGGKVDYRAYAPAAREIAAQGFVVVIAPMPLNLAVFDANEAGEVIRAFPEIKTWAVGGHSLGGAMAASFAAQHRDAVRGVVLWASYPAESDSLVDTGMRVISISGTQDGLATPQKIEESRGLLPADTVWLAIAGGNHAQFGWYGAQQGDHPAEIERSAQQAQVVAGTVEFLKRLEQQ